MQILIRYDNTVERYAIWYLSTSTRMKEHENGQTQEKHSIHTHIHRLD